jgi:hypothetical protein
MALVRSGRSYLSIVPAAFFATSGGSEAEPE